MSHFNRIPRQAFGLKAQQHFPCVMKEFQLAVPDDWKEKRTVDNQGWVDIPAVQAIPSKGRLIVIKIKDQDGIGFRLLDKKGYDKLLDRLNSPGVLTDEVGAEDKGEFFRDVDSIDFDPSGKIRLTNSQLCVLEAESEVELRVVKGELEIRCNR